MQPISPKEPAVPALAVYRRLSRLNPLWFISCYTVTLFLFGCMFYSLPMRSFYAPYARFEPNAYEDGLEVIGDITRALKRPERHPYSELGIEWSIDPQTIHVSRMTNSTLSRLEFNVSFSANGEFANGSNRGVSFNNFDVAISLHPQLATIFKHEQHYVHRVEVVGLQSALTDKARAELFRVPSIVGSDALGPATDFDGKGEVDLSSFLVGLSGEPSSISGFFGRMQYLSATTITTTGFGDIVPLSGTARLLCGVEAVLGWLFAGLF